MNSLLGMTAASHIGCIPERLSQTMTLITSNSPFNSVVKISSVQGSTDIFSSISFLYPAITISHLLFILYNNIIAYNYLIIKQLLMQKVTITVTFMLILRKKVTIAVTFLLYCVIIIIVLDLWK